MGRGGIGSDGVSGGGGGGVVAGELREVFEKLKGKLSEINSLEGVRNLLTWDQQVFMPVNGGAARGEQQAVIARVVHAHQTDEALGEYLEKLTVQFGKLQELGFSQLEIASVREAARDYTRTKKKPVELAARAARLESTGVGAWQKARKENDFSLFAPVLQEWLEIVREEAAAVDPELDVYDFCLDKYERGATRKSLDPFFASIKNPLIELLRQILKKREEEEWNNNPNPQFLHTKESFSGSFSVETQKRLAKKLSEELGFEYASGRFDESVHPMTINIVSPFDVRLTSRFSETDLSAGILATLHETGHGLYEQGRDAEACKDGLPASRPPGLGLHESQSLLWEKQVGMSAEYWEHYWPEVLTNFSTSLPNKTAEDSTQFHKAINEIKPSFIRVYADEVSYPLHILLRYEIEKGLLDGSLPIADVPAVWNQKMKEYLGIVPKNDTEGCLQDIHWGLGAFGYFPTYTLGAVYASMLLKTAEKQIPQLRQYIKEGQFKPLREWLREKIHVVGSLYETADELIENITGTKLDASCFLNYLSRKYGALYDLSTPAAETKADVANAS
jgi:carboxypeptidase Taq